MRYSGYAHASWSAHSQCRAYTTHTNDARPRCQVRTLQGMRVLGSLSHVETNPNKSDQVVRDGFVRCPLAPACDTHQDALTHDPHLWVGGPVHSGVIQHVRCLIFHRWRFHAAVSLAVVACCATCRAAFTKVFTPAPRSNSLQGGRV